MTAFVPRSRRTTREGRSVIQFVIVQCCVTIHCVIEGGVHLDLRTTPYSRRRCGSKVILTYWAVKEVERSVSLFERYAYYVRARRLIRPTACARMLIRPTACARRLLKAAACEDNVSLSTDSVDLLAVTLHGPCNDRWLPDWQASRPQGFLMQLLFDRQIVTFSYEQQQQQQDADSYIITNCIILFIHSNLRCVTPCRWASSFRRLEG